MFIVSTDSSVPSLDQNIPCLRCGYNLRTLSSDARCPECSAAIYSSLDPTLLRYADPSWTTILAFALGITIAGAFFDLLYMLLIASLNNFPDSLWSTLWFT